MKGQEELFEEFPIVTPMTNFERIVEWHDRFGVPSYRRPIFPSAERVALRKELMQEEMLKELFPAMDNEDLVEIADGLADLLYVVYGTAAEYGIPIDEVYAEVHRSNMSKLGEDGLPIYRADGKVLKGPNYSPPDIEAILKNAATR